MVNFGYPYNDIVICKDSTDYLLINEREPEPEQKVHITMNTINNIRVSKYCHTCVSLINMSRQSFNAVLGQ